MPRLLAEGLQSHAFVYAQPPQLLDVPRRVVAVCFVYGLGEIYVRRVCEGIHQIDYAVRLLARVVRVGNVRAASPQLRRVLRIVAVRGREAGVLDQNQRVCKFERRAGRERRAHGVVVVFGIAFAAALALGAEVDHCQYVARSGLHDYRHAERAVFGDELAAHPLVGHLLQTGVDRGHYVAAVLGIDVVGVVDARPETVGYLLLHGTPDAACKLLVADALDAVCRRILDASYDLSGEIVAVGVYALVELLSAERDAHVAVEDRKPVAHHAPLVEGYFAREYLYRTLAVLGGIVVVEDLFIVPLREIPVAVARGILAREETRQTRRQRVGLLVEALGRGEALGSEVERGLIPEYRRCEGLAAARQNSAAVRRYLRCPEDVARQNLCAARHRAAEHLHPYQTRCYEQSGKDKHGVQHPYPKQYVFLGIRSLFGHIIS